MIYFVKCNEYLKIGFTDNFSSRLKHARTFNPYNLEVVKVIEGTVKEERLLHEQFKKYHHQLEWFLFSDEIKQYIDKQKAIDYEEEDKKGATKMTLKARLVLDDLYKRRHLKWEDTYTDIVYITPAIRKEIAHTCGISTSNIGKYLKTLIKLGYISGEKGCYKLLHC